MASYTQQMGTDPLTLWKMGAGEIAQKTGQGISTATGVAKSGVKTVLSTTKKILEGLGSAAEGAGSTVKALPLILGILAVGVAGYLIFAGRKGTDLAGFLPVKRMMK